MFEGLGGFHRAPDLRKPDRFSRDGGLIAAESTAAPLARLISRARERAREREKANTTRVARLFGGWPFFVVLKKETHPFLGVFSKEG